MCSRHSPAIVGTVSILSWVAVAHLAHGELRPSLRPAGVTEQAVTFRTVALTGQPVSGGPPGATVSDFGSAVINNAGHVAFIGLVGIPYYRDNAMLADRGTGLSVVGLSGSQVPVMAPGFAFAGFNHRPVLNDQGLLVFPCSVRGPGANGTYSMCFWRENYGTWSIEAQKGQQAPDTPSGTLFNLDLYACPVNCVPISTPVLNNAGQIAFWSDLTRTRSVPRC
jgi:hypothetical protein